MLGLLYTAFKHVPMSIPSKWLLGFAAAVSFAASATLLVSEPQGDSPVSSRNGFVKTVFTDKSGASHNYLVYLPIDYQPGQARPLLLFLNGLMENGDDGYHSISNNFGVHIWEMKRDFPFVCAIPQCAVGSAWEGKQLDLAVQFADFVQQRYGTDPDRMYVTGVSSGGRGVWNAISDYPGRFAAAVPMCGNLGTVRQRLASIDVPIWNFINSGDEPALVQENRSVMQQLIDLGLSPICTEYDLPDHNCWDSGYRSMGLYRWLLDQRRPATTANRRFKLHAADAVVSHWESQGDGTWEVFSEDHSIAFRFTGQQLSPDISPSIGRERLVCHQASGEFEFHGDAFVSMAGEPLRISLINRGHESALHADYEFFLPLPHAGVGGVQTGVGLRLADLDPVAQQQLQADQYNDIRISVSSTKIQLRINGWLAFDLPTPSSDTAIYSPALIGSGKIRWKNIRTRGEFN